MSDNPMGTNGFEFVEFTAPQPEKLKDLFTSMGFTLIAKHHSQDVSLFAQNDINFIINAEPKSFAEKFNRQHGPAACGMAFRVADASKAFELAVKAGAKPYTGSTTHIGKNIPAIYGIGDSLLYFIDQYADRACYINQFAPIATPKAGTGLKLIDHLTHNVNIGEMDTWANYYERIFNFKQIRYFDIQGKHTGLISRAMGSPCGKIKIPLNESKDEQSQISEYLKDYNGEGIQHIALSTDSIYKTVEMMQQNGVGFMDTPDTYYELIDQRLPGHGENIADMQKLRILIDGGEAQGGGMLLQIFTNTVVGPIFFEIIQRKGNQGFGEGNFQALFDSIELDQIRRGVIKT